MRIDFGLARVLVKISCHFALKNKNCEVTLTLWGTTEISETRDVTESSVQRQILRSGAFSCSAQTFDAGHWIQ